MPFNSQIDIFPICLLVLIYFDAKGNLASSKRNTLFCAMLASSALVLILDCVSWLFQGMTFVGAREILYLTNYIYFVFTLLVSFEWFIFMFLTLFGEESVIRNKRRFIVSFLPIAICIVTIFIKTDLYFYFSPDNMYMRGPLLGVHMGLGFCYLILASAHGFALGIGEKVPAKKREKFHLAAFMLLPMVGGAVQVYDSRLSLLWPFVAGSALMLYISMRHSDIQKDSLTGTWNRRWLDEYLNNKFKESGEQDEWCLFLIDLDYFKKLNDDYGHTEGNVALKKVSDILKEVYFKEKSFVARYGGDEFMVVMDCSEKMAGKMIKDLNARLDNENQNTSAPYKIKLSIGGATFEKDNYETVEQLIAKADQNMYENKNARR